MFKSRNKLYALILIACGGGYIWLIYNFLSDKYIDDDFGVCIFKQVTNLPCPSCGTTRSIASLIHGDLVNSLFWNPLGIVVLLIMTLSPIWIFFDFITKKNSFHKAYHKAEYFLRHRKYSIPLILLIIANWIWNIYKDL